ncbi:MAG: tripartite tricarboxylate transporter substrate binding protein [Betaproteobacteria bacterium]
MGGAPSHRVGGWRVSRVRAKRRFGISRRGVIVAATAFACAGQALLAHAQFGDRPVTLVVGSSPGGGVDRTARLLAPELAGQLHQNVIVENRAGAGTRLASEYVAKSAPDGRTLLFTTGESTIDLAFDPQATPNILKDLVPVSLVAVCQMLLVINASLPVRDVTELLARARAAPGKLNYSTAGVKTTMHLVGALFAQRTGTDIVHIPYKGTMPALAALMARDVDMTYASLPSALPFVESGRLRALAVAGSRRSSLMPDVPTLAESGVTGVQANIWYGLLAPAGTPADIVDALARAVNAASRSADYRQSLATMGEEPSPGTPAAFGELLQDDVSKYGAVIRAARIPAE